MTDEKIYDLACMFKDAILSALAEGFFENDDKFCRFPKGCCGDTCYLLASFLKNYGVETLYVWGDYGMRSHAWLVINDNRVKKPTPRYIEIKKRVCRDVKKIWRGD